MGVRGTSLTPLRQLLFGATGICAAQFRDCQGSDDLDVIPVSRKCRQQKWLCLCQSTVLREAQCFITPIRGNVPSPDEHGNQHDPSHRSDNKPPAARCAIDSVGMSRIALRGAREMSHISRFFLDDGVWEDPRQS